MGAVEVHVFVMGRPDVRQDLVVDVAAGPAQGGHAEAVILRRPADVLAVGADAKVIDLRPHRLRHTYATRLRQGGADPAQVQARLGHSSIETSARYFRAGSAEQAVVVERVFEA